MPDILESQVPAETRSRPGPVAPWLHTLFLLVVLGLWALYGFLHARILASVMPRSISYISHIVLECLLAGTTIAGLYDRRRFISFVIGRVTPRGLMLDVAHGILIYFAGMASVIAIWMVVKHLHVTYASDAVRATAPHSWSEVALFTILSLSAGICEEFVFRGYLLRQFQRWSGSTLFAVVLSSVVFGCLHLYEGTGPMLEIGGLGAVYAIVALRRGNLRGVMVAHFLQDAVTGLILYLRH